jgi:hypothetical protein
MTTTALPRSSLSMTIQYCLQRRCELCFDKGGKYLQVYTNHNRLSLEKIGAGATWTVDL